MASAHEDPAGANPESGEDLGQLRNAQYHLRPVDGKGLKPIPTEKRKLSVVIDDMASSMSASPRTS